MVGAFRNIGREKTANEIIDTMKNAGYNVRETDPFQEKTSFMLNSRETSPHANRIKLMWHNMRQTVIDTFPKVPGLPKNKQQYLKKVDGLYVSDAYHSLSIEGYRVTESLIEKMREGKWDPHGNHADQEQKNALAARGYWQAFQEVKHSIEAVLDGKDPGDVAYDSHTSWYRNLFAPSITVGILKASDLAGYRNSQVYILGSRHTPPNKNAVLETMPVLFDLLKEETEPAVRAVLGHFVFTYIHPYMDGNGRIARFLMNVMLASGGYPWTVIPVETRENYLAALEKASIGQNITDFSAFLAQHVKNPI